MHTSELFRLDVSAQKSINHSIVAEALTHHKTKSQEGDIPFIAVFLAHISFMIIWAMVVYLVSSFCKAIEDPPESVSQDKDEIVTIKYLQQHPCKNCHFFNNNHYLKCAIHPKNVLTQQAFNCSDHSPK